jgi:hypothetical protein
MSDAPKYYGLKMLSLYSRTVRPGKRRAFVFLLSFPFLSLVCLALPFPISAQTVNKIVIPRAAQIVFSHTGIHTHANYLLFDTGTVDIQALQRDPVRYPHLTLKAHSSLPTNHAALPPDLAAFSSPGDPPLANPYGPIDGGSNKPGWTLLPGHQNGKNVVKVLVPTRFANWLALQPPARRRLYAQPKRYTLVVMWQ